MLLTFSLAITPTGTSLTAANVAALPTFLRASAASFAQLLDVPAANVYAANLTDIATGAVTQLAPPARRLGGAAGSKGVGITYVVRLGKVRAGTNGITRACLPLAPHAVSARTSLRIG